MVGLVAVFTALAVLVYHRDARSIVSLSLRVFLSAVAVPAIGLLYSGGEQDDAASYRGAVAQFVRAGLHVHARWGDGTTTLVLLNGELQRWLALTDLQLILVVQVLIVFATRAVWRSVDDIDGHPNKLTGAVLWWAPSALYWSSRYGKDGWTYLFVMLMVNVLVGELCNRRASLFALICGAIGILGLAALRPYIGVAVLIGYLLAQLSRGGNRRRSASYVMAVAVTAGFVILQKNAFLLSGENVYATLNRISAASNSGGAKLGLAPVTSFGSLAIRLPQAILTTAVRPLIWEARSLFVLISVLQILAFWSAVWFERRKRRGQLAGARAAALGRFGLLSLLGLAIVSAPTLGNVGTFDRLRSSVLPAAAMTPFILNTRRKERLRRSYSVSRPSPPTAIRLPTH